MLKIKLTHPLTFIERHPVLHINNVDKFSHGPYIADITDFYKITEIVRAI